MKTQERKGLIHDTFGLCARIEIGKRRWDGPRREGSLSLHLTMHVRECRCTGVLVMGNCMMAFISFVKKE